MFPEPSLNAICVLAEHAILLGRDWGVAIPYGGSLVCSLGR